MTQHGVVDLLSTANHPQQLKLHLKGSTFQLKVWQALLTILDGQLCSYSQLSEQIECPKAQRAVGAAIGQNPIAVIIPCHRVIQTSGAPGGYRWGLSHKINLIEHELMPDQLLPNTDITSYADPPTS